MRWIKYKQLVGKQDDGTEVFQDMGAEYSEDNLEIVKGLAYNGEYTIEDDEQPEIASEPSTDEILNALLGVTE